MKLTRRELIKYGLIGLGGAAAGAAIDEALHFNFPGLFFNFRGEQVPEWDRLAALTQVNFYIGSPELHKSDVYTPESVSVLERVLSNEQQAMDGDITINSIIYNNLVKFLKVRADGEREIKIQGGCGFLITTDGFIVTTYHTVKKLLEKLQEAPNDSANTRYLITGLRGKEYPVDENFIAFNPYLDIAIVRALIPRNPEPVLIPFANGSLQEGDEVTLYALHNGLVFSRTGNVVRSTTDIKVNGDIVFDSFVTDIEAGGGSSGSVFVQGRNFVGTAIYESQYPLWWGGNKTYIGGAKSGNIAYLARKSTERLRSAIYS